LESGALPEPTMDMMLAVIAEERKLLLHLIDVNLTLIKNIHELLHFANLFN